MTSMSARTAISVPAEKSRILLPSPKRRKLGVKVQGTRSVSWSIDVRPGGLKGAQTLAGASPFGGTADRPASRRRRRAEVAQVPARVVEVAAGGAEAGVGLVALRRVERGA